MELQSLENSALRLILFNQYKIMNLLNKNNEIFYSYYQDILVEGIETKYPALLETIEFGSSGVSVKVSDDVDLILEMFCKVQNSIQKVNLDVQRELEEGYHIFFDGFNIDNEAERPYYTYSKFVHKYKEVKLPAAGDGSSGLTLHHYNQMMNSYMRYRSCEILSEEKIRKICIKKGEKAGAYEAILVDFTDSTHPFQLIKEDKSYQTEKGD